MSVIVVFLRPLGLRLEKDFKATVKKGYAMLFIADSKYEQGKPHPIPMTYSIPANHTTPEAMAKFRSELNGKGYNEFKEFKSLEDFIIK